MQQMYGKFEGFPIDIVHAWVGDPWLLKDTFPKIGRFPFEFAENRKEMSSTNHGFAGAFMLVSGGVMEKISEVSLFP